MIRQSLTNNPCGLKIGERVIAEKQSQITYNDDNEKVLTKYGERISCFVVGCVKRAEGTLHKGGSYQTLDGYDYEPPYFTAKKYHWLYECKQTLNSQPFLVLPEDIRTEEN